MAPPHVAESQVDQPPSEEAEAERDREGGGDIGVAVEGDRISVHAEEASLRHVLARIASEAGLALSIQGEHDRSVTVRLDRVPLPEALDRIVRNDYALAGNRLLVFLGPARSRQAPDTSAPVSSPGAPTPQETTPVPDPGTATPQAPGTPADSPPQ